jgi:ATP-binding cassette subfamily B protein
MSVQTPPKQAQPSLFSLLGPYKRLIIILALLTIVANGLNLLIPKIIAQAIDAYTAGHFVFHTVLIEFLVAAISIFTLTALQSVVQTYASERVARDIRTDLSAKISRQSYGYIQEVSPAKLLTNLTSDIDSIKTYVSLAIVTIISSVVLIIGASILLLMTNWKLALVVLTIIPLIGGIFFFVFRQVRTLFTKSREVIDWLNKVINESILGAALIRVLDSNRLEHSKFTKASVEAKDIGMSILSLFSTMIPLITFIASLATLSILTLGGHFVILGTMTLGSFAAFNSYVTILIFPIIILGFMSNVIAQASASYARVSSVLASEERKETGTLTDTLTGEITLQNITVSYGGKKALKDISIHIEPHTKTAIIGPTAAGKTQLLYLLIGLIEPDAGIVEYDGRDMHIYERTSLYHQIGFVFQDSVMFNLSVRENIAFSDALDATHNPTDKDTKEKALQKAIDTAELNDFVEALPEKLDTIVSERGTSLSGGQKQRIMLARALALNPKILLLDDFTARVDRNTEQKILANISKNYPDLTLISVTQKITSVEQYDQIILLMEGEVLATGTHEELLHASPEYVQIYNSQQSTSAYESHS